MLNYHIIRLAVWFRCLFEILHWSRCYCHSFVCNKNRKFQIVNALTLEWFKIWINIFSQNALCSGGKSVNLLLQSTQIVFNTYNFCTVTGCSPWYHLYIYASHQISNSTKISSCWMSIPYSIYMDSITWEVPVYLFYWFWEDTFCTVHRAQ